MPPSGYSTAQASALREFLLSCSKSLRMESLRDGRTPQEGLYKECNDIERELNSNPALSTSVAATLEFTRSFYRRLLLKNPTSFTEFECMVDTVLNEIEKEILDVHIEPPCNPPIFRSSYS